MMKTVLAAAATALLLAGTAHAADATLTADNSFALYTGNAAGSDLALVGTGSDWQTAYTFSNFAVAAGDYLYVVAHNISGPAGWSGVFSTPTGTVYSDTTSWDYSRLSFGAALPSLDVSTVTGASWSTPVVATTASWGNVVGNSNAQWIWSCNCLYADENVLFRTKLPVATAAVPEPETYALMAAGLGVLGFLGKRRRKTA